MSIDLALFEGRPCRLLARPQRSSQHFKCCAFGGAKIARWRAVILAPKSKEQSAGTMFFCDRKTALVLAGTYRGELALLRRTPAYRVQQSPGFLAYRAMRSRGLKESRLLQGW